MVDDSYQESISQKEDNVALREAIDLLQPEYREVIKMSFFQDMNQQEIAEETGVSQMQVSRRIKKALEELSVIIMNQWG